MDFSHPYANAKFEKEKTSSLFLKLIRYFIKVEDDLVFYKVVILQTQHRLNTIRELNSIMGLELKEANTMVDGFSPVAQDLNYKMVSKLSKRLENIGAEVSISEEIINR